MSAPGRPKGEYRSAQREGSPASAAAPAAPLRWQQGLIERIVVDTPRVVSVFVTSALARHVAGQHVDVRLTADDGYTAQRSYSIASAPGSDHIELAIERLDDGEVSPYFHDIARPGDTFELRGPIGGHFIWRGDDGGPLLLVGGGSGIVPLMAIARHRASVAPATAALLVYSSRTWDDVIYRDELITMDTNDPAFSLVLATTRTPRHRVQDFDTRIDAPVLRALLLRWGHAPRHVYACGSNAFVESMTTSLVGEGIAPLHIRAERYGGSGD
ncbi:MAG: FAD-binding oxidoreductase [Betaproteobacteria bacterium]